MTDFNTWNNELIASVQKHLNTCDNVGDAGEFQYIIDAIDSLTDDEIIEGFNGCSLNDVRSIPDMLRRKEYGDSLYYLGYSYDSCLPQEGSFWLNAYRHVKRKIKENT